MLTLTLSVLLLSPWTAPLDDAEVLSWSTPTLACSEASPALRRLSSLRLAWQLAQSGEGERAFALLEPIAEGTDPLAVAARFHRARIGLDLGAPVSPRLRELFGGEAGPIVRWGITRQEEANALQRLALRLEEEDQTREAERLRLHVAVEYPRWSDPAAEMSRADLRRRAENLIRDMDYAGGVAALKRLLAGASAAEQIDLKREIGRVIGDKLRDDYVRVAAIFRDLADGPSGTPDDMLYYAYAVGKLDPAGAAAIYRRFIERFPSDPRITKASFMIAWTQLDLERFPAALAAFDDFLTRYPNSGYRYAVRWYRGLTLFRLARFAEAREEFEFTARYTSEHTKGSYWTARAFLEAGEADQARPIFNRLAAAEPFSYYGMMARAWLPPAEQPPLYDPSATAPSVGLSDAEASEVYARLPEATRDRLDEAFAAMQVGHPDLAAALLEHAELNGLGAGHLRPFLRWLQPRLGTVHRHIRTSGVRRCHSVLDQDPSAPTVRECWEALYPSPYADLIEAVRGDVPAEVFWAIMRQESYFMPAARSHADALGLTQVIPQVGRPAAEADGQTFAPYELTRPATNLRFFAHAANERYRRFGGHLPLVFMSYNATPERTWAWLEDNYDLPFDLFVEEIPYGETRDYVKRLSSHLARYRTLQLQSSVPLLERAGLPHPGQLTGEAFADVVVDRRETEVASLGLFSD